MTTNEAETLYKDFLVIPSLGLGKTFSVQVCDPSSGGLLYWMDGWNSLDEALEDGKKWIDENVRVPEIEGFCQTVPGGDWTWTDGDDLIRIFNMPNTHLYAYSVNGNRYYPSAQSVEEAADLAFRTLDYLDKDDGQPAEDNYNSSDWLY